MNTYNLTEIELQEWGKQILEVAAKGFVQTIAESIRSRALPPIPISGAKKEDIQPINGQLEADQRDGIYGVSDKASVNPILHNGKYRRLASELFSMAADEFSNHGCNDLDPKLLEGWTEPERLQLAIDFENYNVGYLEEFDPNHIFFQDYALMGFFAHLLNSEQGVQGSDKTMPHSSNEVG